MKRAYPTPLGTIIEDMMNRAANDPETRRQYIIGLWPKVAGTHVALYTTSIKLIGRSLHVYLSSASLKEQLGYLRETLKNQYNRIVGENVIDNIILH